MTDQITPEHSILHKLASGADMTGLPALKSVRDSALRTLQNTRFPTPRDEEWRFLDLRPITRTSFVSQEEAGLKPVKDVSTWYIPESEKSRLVFIDEIGRGSCRERVLRSEETALIGI